MNDDEILQELVMESFDHLGVLEPLLLEWERDPSSAEADSINLAFRSLHTIKGGFGFFGMQNIKSLSHVMESLMMEVRDGERTLTAEMVEILITAADVLKGLICDPASSDKMDVSAILGQLHDLLGQPAEVATDDGQSVVDGEDGFAPHPAEEVTGGALVRSLFRIRVYSRSDLADHQRGTLELNHQLVAFGEVVDVRIDLSSITGLDADLLDGSGLAYEIIFACDHTADEVAAELGIPVDQIIPFDSDALTQLMDQDEFAQASSTLRHAAAAVKRVAQQADADSPVADPVPVAKSEPTAASEPPASESAPVPEPPSPAPAEPTPPPASAAPAAPAAPATPATPATPASAPSGSATPGPAKSGVADAAHAAADHLKVKLDVIESLMNLGGELVLARNQMALRFSERMLDGPVGSMLTAGVERELTEALDQLAQSVDRGLDVREAINQEFTGIRDRVLEALNLRLEDAPGLRTAIKDFDSVTTGLQNVIMQTRMQPVGTVFNKFARVVRDLARKVDKSVTLVSEGTEVDLDKSILDALVDPLTHLVRNAVDHGVDTPAERVAAGKEERGQVLLRASHVSGSVRIEVCDDGRGINPEVIRAKAVERGLVSAEDAAELSDGAVLEYIMQPGFSTAAAVTDLSGRGVGMDVVKTNIEQIGGTIGISSVLGKGTTFTLQIPLTLAIMPALIVIAGQQRFAIPQANLLEIVRLFDDDSGFERVHGMPVYRLRGDLLPIAHLGQELGLSEEDTGRNILVMQTQNQIFGLVVDEIQDAVEIVVRPISQRLAQVNALAGATILGDGSICLIADPTAIAERAGVGSDSVEHDRGAKDDEGTNDLDQVLLIAVPDGGRMAVLMRDIIRLEKIPSASIDDVGGVPMARHRGDILPLIDLLKVIPERRTGDRAVHAEEREVQDVILINVGETTTGLIVPGIADVVEVPLEQREASRDGVAYCALVSDQITEFLDLPRLRELAMSEEPVQANARSNDGGALGSPNDEGAD